jgi:mannan endo-1,4-beta-mannosidase
MTTRRSVLAAGALGGWGCATQAPERNFVAARDAALLVEDAPYRFVGANLWYGAYLGASAPYGDQVRLRLELDRLSAIGVNNLRVLGGSELSPLRNSLAIGFRDRTSAYNETLLRGLDVLLAEMGARGMRAVIYLANFWEWSGGFATYVSWTNGGRFIDMGDPAHPWPAFADFSAQFYASGEAVELYRDYVRSVVSRVNSVTGVAYCDDPAIMSWQLANEPRPGGGEASIAANMSAYQNWIIETARLIKSIDGRHLVSTGSEGLKGCGESPACLRDAHAGAEIDYLTAHIWPQNWSWVDANDIAGTFAAAEANTHAYVEAHVALARELGKPLIIEEFGFPRDGLAYAPGGPTAFRDRFYAIIQEHVIASARENGPLFGSNFWAWGGEGRARHGDFRMRPEDTSFVGDPPHEPQGWYSVFDGDDSTIAALRAHARDLAAMA